jgi:hypothetical protein
LGLSKEFWNEMFTDVSFLAAKRKWFENRNIAQKIFRRSYRGVDYNTISIVVHQTASPTYSRSGLINLGFKDAFTRDAKHYQSDSQKELHILATVFHEFCHGIQYYVGTLNKKSYAMDIPLESFQEDFNDFMLGVFCAWLEAKGKLDPSAARWLSDNLLLYGSDINRDDAGNIISIDYSNVDGKTVGGYSTSVVKSRLFDQAYDLAKSKGFSAATEHCFTNFKDSKNVLGV